MIYDDVVVYKDQGVLLNAILKYIINNVNLPAEKTIRLMQISFVEWAIINEKNFPEIKYLSAEQRDKATDMILEIFFYKIKYYIKDPNLRKKYKDNCMMIYERWKRSLKDDAPTQWAKEIMNLNNMQERIAKD